MKQVSLSGAPRAHVGKKDAKNLRREGNIPCVMYGGKEQVHFLTNEKEFSKIIFSPEVTLIRINIEGKEHDAIIQEVQYHPVTDRILHVDFLEVSDTKPITISVPIKLEGTAKGVLRGGKLNKKVRKLTIRALKANLPDLIEVNVSKLDIAQSIKVQDLKQEGVEFLDPPRNVVVTVSSSRAVAGETTGAESAEGGEAEKSAE